MSDGFAVSFYIFVLVVVVVVSLYTDERWCVSFKPFFKFDEHGNNTARRLDVFVVT